MKNDFSQTAPGWAVLIGVNQYADEYSHPPLCCCVRDAIALYVVLTHPDYGKLAPDHVLVLLDGSDSELRRTGLSVAEELQTELGIAVRAGIAEELVRKRIQPERENILAEIVRAAGNAQNGDLLLVHFAGHGVPFDRELYLVPPRARSQVYADTAIPLGKVKGLLRESEARCRLLILDACHSGAAIPSHRIQSLKDLWDSLVCHADDLFILAACHPWERSFEMDAPDGTPLHGVFTKYLVEALSLRGNGALEGSATLLEVHEYTRERVKAWVADNLKQGPLQTPVLHPARAASRIVLSGNRESRICPSGSGLSPVTAVDFEVNEARRRILQAREVGAASVVKELKTLLGGCGDPVQRYWMYTALGEIGGAEALNLLRSGLNDDPDPFAREGVQEAMERLGSPSAANGPRLSWLMARGIRQLLSRLQQTRKTWILKAAAVTVLLLVLFISLRLVLDPTPHNGSLPQAEGEPIILIGFTTNGETVIQVLGKKKMRQLTFPTPASNLVGRCVITF